MEVVVGENFTFGKKAAGTVDTLRSAGARLGFAVEAMSLVSEHHNDRDGDLLLDLHPVLRRRRGRGRGRGGAGPSAPGGRRGGAGRRAGDRAGISHRQRGTADVLGHPGRRRVCRLVHRPGPWPGDRQRRAGRALPGRGVGRAPTRPSPDAPARSRRSSSTPRPTCMGSTSRWTSSRVFAVRRSSARSSDLVDAMDDDTERARTLLSAS